MQFTLASSSIYRQSLLKKLHINFDAISPEIDESELKDESVQQQVQRLAVNKAQTISRLKPGNYVIGSDQLASFNKQKLGKPGNLAQATKQLRLLSGRTVQFYTGLCVAHQQSQQLVSLVEKYEVTFRQLTEEQIFTYLNVEQPFDCAGSFKSEGLGIALFESMHGRDPNSLIGLPLIGLIDLFSQLNIDIFKNMKNA